MENKNQHTFPVGSPRSPFSIKCVDLVLRKRLKLNSYQLVAKYSYFPDTNR